MNGQMARESAAAREKGLVALSASRPKELSRGLELGRSSFAVTCSDFSRAEETKAQEWCSLQVLSQLPILPGVVGLKQRGKTPPQRRKGSHGQS